MLSKRLAAMFVSLCITAITGAASTGPASAQADTPKKAANTSDAFTVLNAVSQWSVDLSQMAEKKATSDLVKNFANEVVTTSAQKSAKLMDLAKKHGLAVAPIDQQTEEGKSLLDRMKGEKMLLSSLEGDAFDKEYMTLATNTQQSVIQFARTQKAAAKDPEIKKFMGDLETIVQKRLKTAQDVMAKVYGDRI
jgi:predicted outer membrane protein